MSNYGAAQIIDSLGEEILKAELGFTDRTLRYVRSTGKFSGGWFGPIEELCVRHHVFCPKDAFKWRINGKKNGNAKDKIQGAGKGR